MIVSEVLMAHSRVRFAGWLAGCLLASSIACGGGSSAPARRVFFIEPQDGATVKSPVHLRFGIENFEIAPVPQGTVESVRQGLGHHHVGVDTDCLPPGTEIPKPRPGFFGDRKNEIDMQLPPGSHKLALQIGDDKHTTIGLRAITIGERRRVILVRDLSASDQAYGCLTRLARP